MGQETNVSKTDTKPKKYACIPGRVTNTRHFFIITLHLDTDLLIICCSDGDALVRQVAVGSLPAGCLGQRVGGGFSVDVEGSVLVLD